MTDISPLAAKKVVDALNEAIAKLEKELEVQSLEFIIGTVAVGKNLSIRKGPSVFSDRIGINPSGTELEIVEIIRRGDDTWAKFLRNNRYVYSAIIFKGEKYIGFEGELTTKPLPSEPMFWRVKHDQELQGIFRPNLPEVNLFEPNHVVKMTKEIQEMCYELLKHGMKNSTDEEVKKAYRRVYHWDRAFNNFNGYEREGDPRADFINSRDLDSELPKFDKPRVCGGAKIKGWLSDAWEGWLKVSTLRGAVPVDVLVSNPHLFFEAVSSGKNIAQFPQGHDEPVYIPLITGEDVYFPLWKLKQVGEDEEVDPYYVPR